MRASVAIVTFNHENYIGQAVESALAQETDFDFEIVIGEDCSTDRTRSIVLNLERNHPGKVRVIVRDANIGASKNFTEVFHACRGDYIALLDGDDFWTSPHKLQRQVDFLDTHPDCSMCFHAYDVVSPDGSAVHWHPPGRKPIYTIADLVRDNFIASCTQMVRRGVFSRYPDWMIENNDVPGDWLFALAHARQGNIGYIDEVMAAYRKHSGGVWSAMDPARRIEIRIQMYRQIDAELDFEHTGLIRSRIALMRLRLLFLKAFPFLIPAVVAIRKRFMTAA